MPKPAPHFRLGLLTRAERRDHASLKQLPLPQNAEEMYHLFEILKDMYLRSKRALVIQKMITAHNFQVTEAIAWGLGSITTRPKKIQERKDIWLQNNKIMQWTPESESEEVINKDRADREVKNYQGPLIQFVKFLGYRPLNF